MSNPNSRKVIRALLPLSVFALTYPAHYGWYAFSAMSASTSTSSCESCGGGACGAPVPAGNSYINTQTYLLGYSISLSLAFASVAIRQFFEKRSKSAQSAAMGGVSLSAILGFAGCYLTGCCGSPMLAVYVSLLGAAFLPFAKPLVAALTTLSIIGWSWWLSRSRAKVVCGEGAAAGCCDDGTSCEPAPTRMSIEKRIG